MFDEFSLDNNDKERRRVCTNFKQYFVMNTDGKA